MKSIPNTISNRRFNTAKNHLFQLCSIKSVNKTRIKHPGRSLLKIEFRRAFMEYTINSHKTWLRILILDLKMFMNRFFFLIFYANRRIIFKRWDKCDFLRKSFQRESNKGPRTFAIVVLKFILT